MARIRARFALLCLLAALACMPAGARADGYRFGGFGFGIGRIGHLFGGPRYDGPGQYEIDPNGPRLEERGAMAPPNLPGARACYSSAETRERVASQKLREPFELMRKAAALSRAEALTGKLCRWRDVDIYEISLLRPDGRVIHVFMNAATGAVVGALNAH